MNKPAHWLTPHNVALLLSNDWQQPRRPNQPLTLYQQLTLDALQARKRITFKRACTHARGKARMAGLRANVSTRNARALAMLMLATYRQAQRQYLASYGLGLSLTGKPV